MLCHTLWIVVCLPLRSDQIFPQERKQNKRMRSLGRTIVGLALEHAKTTERWVLMWMAACWCELITCVKAPCQMDHSVSWVRGKTRFWINEHNFPGRKLNVGGIFLFHLLNCHRTNNITRNLRKTHVACFCAFLCTCKWIQFRNKTKNWGWLKKIREKWKGSHAAAPLIISLILMNSVQFTSSESLPSQPFSPQREGSLRLWLASNWEIGSASQCHYTGFYLSPYAGLHEECLKFP